MSDHSQFLLEKIDGRERVWVQPNEHLADACVSETHWFCGGGLGHGMGGISGLYKMNRNLRGVHYRDEILAQDFQPFMHESISRC